MGIFCSRGFSVCLSFSFHQYYCLYCAEWPFSWRYTIKSDDISIAQDAWRRNASHTKWATTLATTVNSTFPSKLRFGLSKMCYIGGIFAITSKAPHMVTESVQRRWCGFTEQNRFAQANQTNFFFMNTSTLSCVYRDPWVVEPQLRARRTDNKQLNWTAGLWVIYKCKISYCFVWRKSRFQSFFVWKTFDQLSGRKRRRHFAILFLTVDK